MRLLEFILLVKLRTHIVEISRTSKALWLSGAYRPYLKASTPANSGTSDVPEDHAPWAFIRPSNVDKKLMKLSTTRDSMPSGSPSLPPQSTRQFFARTFFEDGIYYYEVDPYDIISILIETVCYGVFLILFALSTYLLVQRRRYYLRKSNEKRRLRSIMIYQVTGILMFLTITAKWSFWWAEVFPIHTSQESGAPTRLPRLKRISYRMEEVVTQLTIVLGDLITIYRLWILSSRNKPMIVFPILAFFGYLACAISLSGPANDTTDKPIPIQDGKLRMTNWDIAVVTSTVSITVYIVVAIAWIILRTRYKVASTKISGSRSLNQALVILVESAALYAIWNIIFLIAGAGFESPIALSFLDAIPAIYGISVTLINVRVGLGWARSGGCATPAETGRRNSRRGSRLEIYVSAVVCREEDVESQIEFGRAVLGEESEQYEEVGDMRSRRSVVDVPQKVKIQDDVDSVS
ncbi:hypothetical protein NP233_g12941 [Leucocoprinus birnbaumii]|uniref:Uncharacterized protein n=1 Tax=Leucocoprinus birnbaumii TaxID=56174 RepID=A0AAD5YJY9_9AGAR|nr:hypothetical protein NP233_g12941 [Leucocoprinus birnbaumii]